MCKHKTTTKTGAHKNSTYQRILLRCYACYLNEMYERAIVKRFTNY